jgi:lysozyme family protein
MTTSPDDLRAEGTRRVARLSLRFAVAGVILGLVGPALDAIGGVLGGAAWVLTAVGIFVQAANVAFILGGLVAGIIALARGARPVTRPVLAIVALPISGVLILIEVFVIFLLTTS